MKNEKISDLSREGNFDYRAHHSIIPGFMIIGPSRMYSLEARGVSKWCGRHVSIRDSRRFPRGRKMLNTGIWKSKGVNHTAAIIECGCAFLACAVGVSEGDLRGSNSVGIET